MATEARRDEQEITSGEKVRQNESENLEEAAGAEGEPTAEQKRMNRLKETVIVEKEASGPLGLKLTITVPRDVLNERLTEELNELKKDAVVPGFRRGRAPMTLVEKRFAPDVSDQILSQILGGSYMAATERESLKTIGDPLIWVKSEEERVREDGESRTVAVEKLVSVEKALDVLKLPKEGPFTYQCELELKPDFELPKLDAIPVVRRKVAVTDSQVVEQIERQLAWRGAFQPVEQGTIEKDDMLYVDMRMRVDGEIVKELKNEEMPVRPIRVFKVPLMNVVETFSGKTRGDMVLLEGQVPQDDEMADLRGKKAVFETVILEVKRFKSPELTDELARELGHESADEFRKMVRDQLESGASRAERQAMHRQIRDYLTREVSMDLPERLSTRQTDRIVARRALDLARKGAPEVEIRSKMDEFRSEAKQEAIHDLKLSLIMEKLSEEMKVEVSEEEINGAIASIAAHQQRRFDRVRDELMRDDGMVVLYMDLRDHKIVEALLEKTTVMEE